MIEKNNREILEKKHKELETEKLRNEILELKTKRKRSWIVTISLIIGVFGTAFSAVDTLSKMSMAYKEQAFKSRMETTELFIRQIIPAIKSDESSSQQAARKGAYFAAVSLANEFPNLREPVYVVLEANSENGDTDAKSAITRLKQIKGE